MTSPVMYPGPDNRNKTVSSTSSKFAHLGMGKLSTDSFNLFPSMGGNMAPKAMPLTVIEGAKLTARDFVSARRPDLLIV